MSYSEGHFRPRQPTLPPLSTRTLHHPSFMPLYMAAHLDTDCADQTVCPIIPAECFYTDPTMSCGRRVPNIVSGLRVLDCFQLSTPPPIMSACPAPPACPDPFRSGSHPTRDLGSRTLTMNTLHPPVQPRCRVVLHLTPEEDQAVTNLLKLHHQEPVQSEDTLAALQMHFSSIDLNPTQFHHMPMDSTSAEAAYEPSGSNVQHLREASLQSQLQQRRRWSDSELQAAETLLSRFNLTESDTSAATPPGPLQYQHPGSETLKTPDCSRNNVGCLGVGCLRESGGPGSAGVGFVDNIHLPVYDEYLASSSPPRATSFSSDSEAKSRSSVSGDRSEVREGALSESECVQVLLSLGDTAALDIVQ